MIAVTNGIHTPSWVGTPVRELLERHLGGGESPADVQATLLELTARGISDALATLAFDGSVACAHFIFQVCDCFCQSGDVLVLVVELFLQRFNLLQKLLLPLLASFAHLFLLLIKLLLKLIDDLLQLGRAQQGHGRHCHHHRRTVERGARACLT